jgi:probable addiction module antidote protein
MMSGRSRSYKDGLYRRLKDSAEALNYLQAALEDSQSAFLIALKNVLEARNVAAVARASNLDRVHIYRMLSEGGNPTLNSLEKILHAVGLKLAIDLEAAAPSHSHVVAKKVFHVSWNVYSSNKRKASLYVRSGEGFSSLTDPGISGCEQMICASAEVNCADLPHLASISDREEVYELAY